MKPTLVILAAGMGSRYGGLKQMDSVDEAGNKIIDFSMYDALRENFDEVVFIIKKAIEKDFKEEVGNRVAKHMKVTYVYQELDKLPIGYKLPENRVKPWGTAHALLCCKDVINKPFCVINSDDFYGRDAFKTIHDFLVSTKDDDKMHFAMVGYELNKTLTDNGTVTRGVCLADEKGYLTDIKETKDIKKDGLNGLYKENDKWISLKGDTLVSMNFWGFTPAIFPYLEQGFIDFLNLTNDLIKDEFYIPIFVDTLIKRNLCDVLVLSTKEQWFGVTYKEDKENVVNSIKSLKNKKIYPNVLWD